MTLRITAAEPSAAVILVLDVDHDHDVEPRGLGPEIVVSRVSFGPSVMVSSGKSFLVYSQAPNPASATFRDVRLDTS
jgi:hypothetical protein